VKRPTGVVVHAILLALVSLLMLVAALVFAVGATLGRNGLTAPGAPPAPAQPPWMASFDLVLCALFVVLAGWGVATMAGLFGMRRWARISVLIIGGALGVMGVISLATSVLMMVAFPTPQVAGVDPSQAQLAKSMLKVVFSLIAVFYALVTALGITWLVYFNRKPVKDAFAGGAPLAEGRRPVLIGVIAVLNIIGAPLCVLAAWSPLPVVFLGFTFHGAAKAVLYVGFGLLEGVAGVGLWQLKEWGRRMELALLALGAVHCLVLLVRPSLLTRMNAEVSRVMQVQQPAWTAHFQTVLYRGTFGFSMVLIAAFIVVLQVYRSKFGPGREQRLGPVLVS
jgi:hypothetical protein